MSFKIAPTSKKRFCGEVRGGTRGVRALLNEIEVTADKGGEGGVNAKKRIQEAGIKLILPTRLEVKIKDLER